MATPAILIVFSCAQEDMYTQSNFSEGTVAPGCKFGIERRKAVRSVIPHSLVI